MLIASISNELKCHVWPKGDLLNTYQPNISYNGIDKQEISTISWAKDGKWLVLVPSVGNAEIVSVNTDSPKLMHTILSVNLPSCACFQNMNKRYIALGTSSGYVMLYDIKTKSVTKKMPNAPAGIFKCEYFLKDTHLAVGCKNGCLILYNCGASCIVQTFRVPHSNSLSNFRCHYFKRNLISGCSNEGYAAIWDISFQRPINFLKTHKSQINDLCFSTIRSDILASVGMDHKISFYDFNANCIVNEVLLNKTPTAIDFCPDGIHIALATQDGNIIVYDTRNLTEYVNKSNAHNSKISQILFERASTTYDHDCADFETDGDNEIVQLSKNMKFYTGSHLPEIPEVDRETSSIESLSLSYHEQTESDTSPQVLLAEKSHTKITEGIKKYLKENPDIFESDRKKSNGVLNNYLPLYTPSGTNSQHQEQINTTSKKVDLRSVCVQTDNASSGDMPSNNNKELSNSVKEDMIKMLRSIIHDELFEFKSEMRYDLIEVMATTRQHFLDLQMNLVKEFIKVEESMKTLRDEINNDNEMFDHAALIKENAKLLRENQMLREQIDDTDSNECDI